MKSNRSLHILVYRLSALGDVAMTIPAIYSVAKAYPMHTFVVVTSDMAAHLFIAPPRNVQLRGLRMREFKGLLGVGKLLSQLHQLDIDAVADLHNVLRSWLIDVSFRICGCRVSMLDKMRSERLLLLKKHASTCRQFTLRYFDVFSRLGLKTEPLFSSLFADAKPPLPSLISSKASGEYWVGIAPFARYRSKIYDETLMYETIRQLAALSNIRVFLFGAARGEEKEKLVKWATTARQVVIASGLLVMEEELALMAHLDVMFSMDSANMHMASLTGTRVVSFWGGTTPACGFLGYNQREEDAVMANLDCQPCSIAGSDVCPLGHMNCTRKVTVLEILNKLISRNK